MQDLEVVIQEMEKYRKNSWFNAFLICIASFSGLMIYIAFANNLIWDAIYPIMFYALTYIIPVVGISLISQAGLKRAVNNPLAEAIIALLVIVFFFFSIIGGLTDFSSWVINTFIYIALIYYTTFGAYNLLHYAKITLQRGVFQNVFDLMYGESPQEVNNQVKEIMKTYRLFGHNTSHLVEDVFIGEYKIPFLLAECEFYAEKLASNYSSKTYKVKEFGGVMLMTDLSFHIDGHIFINAMPYETYPPYIRSKVTPLKEVTRFFDKLPLFRQKFDESANVIMEIKSTVGTTEQFLSDDIVNNLADFARKNAKEGGFFLIIQENKLYCFTSVKSINPFEISLMEKITQETKNIKNAQKVLGMQFKMIDILETSVLLEASKRIVD